jgi:hypothetical protein
MPIACRAPSDSCDILPSLFRANTAGVMIPVDLQGFLMDRDAETSQ